jgi:glutamate synthase domain-containing protein 3
VELDDDIAELKLLVENHLHYTGSAVARKLLENWQASLAQFIKVMPTDYKRVLQQLKQEQSKQNGKAVA